MSSMTFQEYDEKARRTAVYLNAGTLRGLTYTVLGVSGEAGEMCGVVKGVLFRGNVQLNQAEEDHLREEIGDVLWYLAACSRELGTTLDIIARQNLEKLATRYGLQPGEPKDCSSKVASNRGKYLKRNCTDGLPDSDQ